MIVKNPAFVKKLNSKIYQYTFNKNEPLTIKGSFLYTTYISDIDYNAYVYFNENFITILIRKIKNLQDFKFLYLKSGKYEDFTVPWVINSERGCTFDIVSARYWFTGFKNKNIIPNDSYNDIEQILYKKTLIIGDLVRIQDILNNYNSIKWSLSDIEKGYQTFLNHKYKLLDVLKKSPSSVINTIYIDGDIIVPVDIGLRDKRYKFPIWSRMYKFYTHDWYAILKDYKWLVKHEYNDEYHNTLKKVEYINALMARTKLLDTIIKYKTVSQTHIDRISTELKINLKKEGINTIKTNEIIKIIKLKINEFAYKRVNYYLDKLTNKGKIEMHSKLRLTITSHIPTNINLIKERKKMGIKCPFFDNDITEFISTLASKLLVNKTNLYKCLETIAQNNNEPLHLFTHKLFNKTPSSRLVLQYKHKSDKQKIIVRGAFIENDYTLLNTLGNYKDEIYTMDVEHLKRIQIYLITGV